MFTILGSDGKEYGPADVATLKSWISGGRATLQTQARRVGETEWKTLADYAEFETAETPPPMPDSAKTQPVKIDAEAFAADLIARAKPLDITGCISRGWAFYISDFWPILGVTLLVFLLISVVPFGGLFATGFGMAGLYYYYLGKMRGQPRQLNDVFVGLSRMTVPLLVGGLVMVAIVFVCMVPGYIFMIVGVVSHSVIGAIIGLTGFLACMVAIMYVSIVLTFTFPLIIDKNLDWKDAMTVSRRVIHAQFWRFLGMVILIGLISCLGLLAFIIGVYFLVPLGIATYAHAYEDLCNPKDAAKIDANILRE